VPKQHNSVALQYDVKAEATLSCCLTLNLFQAYKIITLTVVIMLYVCSYGYSKTTAKKKKILETKMTI
jgi:hypothetical protein